VTAPPVTVGVIQDLDDNNWRTAGELRLGHYGDIRLPGKKTSDPSLRASWSLTNVEGTPLGRCPVAFRYRRPTNTLEPLLWHHQRHSNILKGNLHTS
jgi:hypothetical protein